MQFACYASKDDLKIIDKHIKEIQFLKSPEKITQAELVKRGLTMLKGRQMPNTRPAHRYTAVNRHGI